uniref:Putative secreted protein n=1 Tax=Anopheles triannulatus TaxID=58253 RepID=A0A2M4B559_9DIPT
MAAKHRVLLVGGEVLLWTVHGGTASRTLYDWRIPSTGTCADWGSPATIRLDLWVSCCERASNSNAPG